MGNPSTDSKRFNDLQAISSGVKFVMTQDEMIVVTVTDTEELERVLSSLSIFARLKSEEGLAIKKKIIRDLKAAIAGMSLDAGYTKSDFLKILTKAFDDYIYLRGYVFVVIEAVFGEELASDLRSFVSGNQKLVES